MTQPRTLAFDFATGGGEPVGIWVRVSSGGQDEKNQVPDIRGHVESHDYNVVRQYVLHDKSASKGEQQEALNQVIADMDAGIIKALVCWHSDRLDRRGPKAGYAFLYAAELVNGRIESVLDPDFGKEDVGSEVLSTIRMATARDESKLKSERTRIGFDTIDANGAIRNRAGYGHRIVKVKKYHHRFELDDAEADIIREAVSRYLDEKSNQSLAHICRWLTDSGHRGRKGAAWTPKTLGKVFRSETLIGRYHQGDSVARVPSIITVKQFKAVQAKLDAKAYRKGTRSRPDTALLTSILHCGTCGRPMYRFASRGNNPVVYYCRPKDGISCKMLIPLKEADSMVIEDTGLTLYLNERTQEIVIPGHDYADDIEHVVLDIKALDPKDSDWLARVTELQAEIARLALLLPEPDIIKTVDVDTVAEANAWQQLPIAEKRQRLLDTGLRLYAAKDDDGNITITRERKA